MSSWHLSTLADLAADALRKEAGRLDRAQEIYGLDSIDRFALLDLLENVFLENGLGVHRQTPFPGPARAKTCDLALTPDRLPMSDARAEGTLFAPSESCWPETAFWLNVHTVAQFGEEGPNSAYSRQFFGPVLKAARDLARARGIYHAGCAVLLFCGDEATGRHDLLFWQKHALEKEIPVGSPAIRVLPLKDRMGNQCLLCAFFPVGRAD